MTNPTPHGQEPVSSAVLKAIREANMQLVHTGDDAYMLLPYLQAHVQNPAEIEHVAGDVSKNGAEVNTNVYAELPPRYYLAGGVEKAWDHQQMHAFADATHALRASHGQAPAGAAPAATPSAASIAWSALRDLTDPLGEDGVKIMGHVRIYAQRQYEAGLTEWRATPPAQAADSVREDAALLLRQILAASQDGDSDTHLSAHFVSRIETITKAGGAA